MPLPRPVSSVMPLASMVLALSWAMAWGAAPAARAFDRVELAYSVYGLGTKAFDMQLGIQRQGDKLNSEMRAESRGLVSLVMNFRMTGEGSGQLKRGEAPGLARGGDLLEIAPLHYASLSAGSQQRRTEMVWGPDGLPRVSVEPPPEKDDRKPVPPELQFGAIDPTNAALARSLVPATAAPCAGMEPIYDGRRRFNLHFTALDMQELAPNGRSAYRGPALRCGVRFEPIAGYSEKYLAKTRDLSKQTAYVWLARPDALPGRGADGKWAAGRGEFWLPVKVSAEWLLGEAQGHINGARVDGHDMFPPIVENIPEAAAFQGGLQGGVGQ